MPMIKLINIDVDEVDVPNDPFIRSIFKRSNAMANAIGRIVHRIDSGSTIKGIRVSVNSDYLIKVGAEIHQSLCHEIHDLDLMKVVSHREVDDCHYEDLVYGKHKNVGRDIAALSPNYKEILVTNFGSRS